MPDNEGVGIGELSRQVRDVLSRFEGLVARLETQFVRQDNFAYYRQLVDQAIRQLQETSRELADSIKQLPTEAKLKSLEERVAELEDDKKWLTRLVLGFIVLGVIGAAFALQKAGAGG